MTMTARAYFLGDPWAVVVSPSVETDGGTLEYWVNGQPVTRSAGGNVSYWADGQPIDREDDH